MAKQFVWIRTEKEFIHNYPTPPEGVEFLQHPHSHIFKFKIYIEVFDNDREIEFILFKRFIDNMLMSLPTDLENTSCESLADALNDEISLAYPNRDIKISVSEDNNYGCLKEYYRNE